MRRGGGFPGFFDFHTNKEVQSGPQHDDGGELTDLIPGRRNGGSQDIRSKLEFQGQRQPAPQFQPHLFLVGAVRVAVGRGASRTADKHEGRTGNRDHGSRPDDESRCAFNCVGQIKGEFLEQRLENKFTSLKEAQTN
jgi:hypothetical protein